MSNDEKTEAAVVGADSEKGDKWKKSSTMSVEGAVSSDNGEDTGCGNISSVEVNLHKSSTEENMVIDTGDTKDNSAPDVNNKARSGMVQKMSCRWCSERLQVYASHFLSSWGDRMWMFAGGLFLLEVTPGSLRLAAVYGAALALTVIILGAPVGRWVDRTSRLTAAQVSLMVQNVMVCVCAALLVAITTQRQAFTAWNGWALVVAEIFVILTACVAQIGTLGSKLVIEKDWILVLCAKDKTKLARMNSVLRTVDLSTEVFAPVIVGGIMTGFGMAAGGVFIAAWNVGSLAVEYGLLHHLYYSNADLRKPKVKDEDQQSKQVKKDAEGGNGDLPDLEEEKQSRREEREWHGKGRRWRVAERVLVAWGAWRAYMVHPVRDAGLGLALLFMTVLAFDNYSRAFVYDSGVPETVLGVLTAAASLFGIFGSLAFPLLRSRIGVTRTGLVGFVAETTCLTLCVASVFAPGSPFDAPAILGRPSATPVTLTSSANHSLVVPELPVLPESVYSSANNSSSLDVGVALNWTLMEKSVDPSYSADSVLPTTDNPVNTTGNVVSPTLDPEQDYTFVILFLCGIITSRFGLWVADLSVTQILQEGVAEGQRGAINGVQSSLNQSLDLLRSILIIIFPLRETFGFLIILSFIFVSMALFMFGLYARKQPAHNSSSLALETASGEGEKNSGKENVKGSEGEPKAEGEALTKAEVV